MKKWTIDEIEQRLFSKTKPDLEWIKELRADSRKGAQRLVARWENQQEAARTVEEKFIKMTQYESRLRKEGFQVIAGIDEAGRGPLAGPVAAAAVILPEDFYLPGLNDSKQLTELKRNQYFDYIMENAVSVGISLIHAEEIDQINILEASKKAMLTAVASLQVQPDYLLIDAVKLTVPYPSEAIIKGDSKSISIAAASVIAKVTRDRLMRKADADYPEYGFSKNMGYGTAEHITALKEYGATPLHRKSFAPVRETEQINNK